MPSARIRFRVGKPPCVLACGLLTLVLAACASAPQGDAWESRLRGNTIVLLGELHDNPHHHRLRLETLRRAFAAGWRPAIMLEQLDREKQSDIDRARAKKPRDAQHVIDSAAPRAPVNGTRGGGWNWDYYRPFVALALEYDVPLIAANLSNADAVSVVREGYTALFDAQTMHTLGLDRPVPQALQAAQELEIDIGHCKALPAQMLPPMARGQMARDAVMANRLAQNAARGVVLIAGNGHVRRDLGVPYWLDESLRARTLAVGYLEASPQGARPARETNAAFDVVVHAPAADRTDPCIEFKRRAKPS